MISLNGAWLEKRYAYTSWLSRLLPSRDVPADITITDDMLTLSAFRWQKIEEGTASLARGEKRKLDPITEFGATPCTEEEERSLSEIIDVRLVVFQWGAVLFQRIIDLIAQDRPALRFAFKQAFKCFMQP